MDIPDLPCDQLSGPARAACRAAELVGPGSPALVALPGPGDLVGRLGDFAMRGLTSFVVDGAAWLLKNVATAVTASTHVRVQSEWFTRHYEVMAALAGSFALLFLLLSAGSAVIHQDPRRVGRSVAMVAAAGLGTGAVLVITDLLLVISDQMSALVARNMAGDLAHALGQASDGLGSITSGPADFATPLFPALLAALLVAVAAVVIWIELLLREVAIYAVVLFFPLALAGLVWDASRVWSRRLAEFLVALIFSKFVIVAILALASGGLASASEGFGGVLAGAALLVLATFSPFMLMRVIGVFEVAAAAAVLDGSRQRGSRPVVNASQTALHAAQRQRAGRAAGITVAGAGAPSAAIPFAASRAARPPAPSVGVNGQAPGAGANGQAPPIARGA